MSLRVPTAASEGFEAPTAEEFWQPLVGEGAFALTRPMVLMALATLIVGAVMVLGTRRLAVVPGKGQAALEGVYGIVRNSIARDMIGAAHFRPHLPLLFSLFTLILVNNLFGIIPPLQYPTMSRIGFPIALTLFVYVVYLGIGIRRKGVGGYLRGLVPHGLPAAVVPLIFLLELITYFVTRPVTLALRLFGNMFAGHILLLLFALGGEYMLTHGGLGLKLVSIPTFLMAFVLTVFELLIEFLQAYIFTLLAAFYIADSYAEEH
ncbi:F0F1 ATP synthase subunit A [Quadrisphaera sp. DSM 44207]|uniref:F0F1 ATP synthase subunit A n=1 Tax=Quadrisphaera sp. DSM 44207 TaxID=1881057 RepID=UPI00087FB227|nr:F0F1 ATP synthase subunit A [Quadrisphaera sp. DSM 44207]SDQ73462.1 ATP synthase F0 subcomplex A subunit [Quadrisphaera sp. DSM 44207]